MSAKKPRAAYCTGCDTLFPKMHLLIRHRRNDRCGGRFLPPEKRLDLAEARRDREDENRTVYLKYIGGGDFRALPTFSVAPSTAEYAVNTGKYHYRTRKQWKRDGRR